MSGSGPQMVASSDSLTPSSMPAFPLGEGSESASLQSCAAISFLLKQLIKSAHKDFPDHLAPPLKVKAHDVRGVATSLL